MRRAVHVILCLVLFTAAMEGLNYLLTGFSEAFGVGCAFGVILGMATIGLITDREELTPLASGAAVGMLTAIAVFYGYGIGRFGGRMDFLLGPLVGFGLAFPVTYWAVGDDRAKRGNPRPPISWRWSPPEA